MAFFMRSSTSVIFIVGALLVYSALTLWQAMVQGTAWYLVWTVPAVVAALGLLLRQRWSRFVLYVLNICLVGGWGMYTSVMWQHVGENGMAKLVALGIALVAFAIWSSLVTSRLFRATAAPQGVHVDPEKP